MLNSPFWMFHSQRLEATEKKYPKLNQLCLNSLDSMWKINQECGRRVTARSRGTQIPAVEQCVSIYYQRNITYLRAAYLLASVSLTEPTANVLRTIYETILRGYFFIVRNDEADLMCAKIEQKISNEDKDRLRKRKYWPFRFLIGELYTEKTKKSAKLLFEDFLSRSSHPSVRSAMVDFNYSGESVNDKLNLITMLSYGNIQMLAECFFDYFTDELKLLIKNSLFNIADFYKEVPVFEPDKPLFFDKIRLRNGNFMELLK
jgi:hypothetical protein